MIAPEVGEGYRLEYRQATPEEVEQVLPMPLPGAHDWASLYAHDPIFTEVALPRLINKNGGIFLIGDYFGVVGLEKPADKDVANPDNMMKAWLLLLAGRLMPVDQRDAMFGKGFFHGVVLPCHASEAGVVRQVLWNGSSPPAP